MPIVNIIKVFSSFLSTLDAKSPQEQNKFNVSKFFYLKIIMYINNF